MRLKQNVIYQKVCESLEKDRVYLRLSLSLSELSVIVVPTITLPAGGGLALNGSGGGLCRTSRKKTGIRTVKTVLIPVKTGIGPVARGLMRAERFYFSSWRPI